MAANIKPQIWTIILLIVDQTAASSLWYNRPAFSPCASWNPNATTFASNAVSGYYTHGLFVGTDDTLYAGSWYNSWVKVWLNGSSNPSRTITAGLSHPYSVFVASNGDIYIDNGASNGRVDKWMANATSAVMVMNISTYCSGLFIDTNNTLYCCLLVANTVVKTSLLAGVITPTTVAGTGVSGSAVNQLREPWGVFVDLDFTLYVADAGNNRVQRFAFGQTNGTTVAGSTAPIKFALRTPTSVVLDANGYMFISDTDNFRIVASSSTGFRCIAGCSAAGGSTASTLNHARYLAFDSHGNLFVSDDDNQRIQKFVLASNSCDISSTTIQPTVKPTTKYPSSATSKSTSSNPTTSVSLTSAATNPTTSVTLSIWMLLCHYFLFLLLSN